MRIKTGFATSTTTEIENKLAFIDNTLIKKSSEELSGTQTETEQLSFSAQSRSWHRAIARKEKMRPTCKEEAAEGVEVGGAEGTPPEGGVETGIAKGASTGAAVGAEEEGGVCVGVDVGVDVGVEVGVAVGLLVGVVTGEALGACGVVVGGAIGELEGGVTEGGATGATGATGAMGVTGGQPTFPTVTTKLALEEPMV